MDERTRTTDDKLAPNLRRPTPEPDVKSPVLSRSRIITGVIVILLVVAGYETVHLTRTPQAPGGRFQNAGAQSVGAATVGTGNIRVIVNALGTVTPIATVTVQSQISGYLTEVPFIEGQMVNKGDLIAQIDDRQYQILKAQYEGQLAHDQAVLSQAQMDLKRYQTLAAQNSIAKQQADDQVFIVQQDEGTVKQDQGLIDAQALDIAYCRIVSPVTGRIGLRLVDPGNYVQSASTTGIAVVTELQPITVIFAIPEDDLPQIMPQIYTGTKLQVTAFDRANVKQLAVGSVFAVDSQINTTTGTVNVRAQFDNTNNAMFPNQFVNAQLLVSTLQNVVTVPSAAIQLGAAVNGGAGGGTSDSGNPGSTSFAANASAVAPSYYVYVVNANNTVSVRQITIGPTDGSMTEVNSGLVAGDKVVTDGTDRLRDGLPVNISTLDGKPVNGAEGGAGPAGRRAGGGQGGGNRGSGAVRNGGEPSQNSNRSQTQGSTNGGQ
jgi:multidrug efflux system membrane fusion protein